MTVECPGCNTRFPVDSRKVPDGGVHARCSVCSEVFFVEVQAPEIEMAPAFMPEDEPTGIAVDLPEAEVLEEEAAPKETWDAGATTEMLEDEAETVFEAPEALEEEPEPVFEAPEPIEEEPEPAFEAPEPEEEQELPFELPAIASEEPGPLVPEPEPSFELPDIVTEERTFGDGAPTFGDGETTFSMDSPTFDTHVEVNEETTPTFGDPSPTIEFTDFPGLDVQPSEEPAWEEAEPAFDAPEAPTEETEPSFEAPATDFAEPEPVFETPEGVGEEAPATFETLEPVVEEPPFTSPPPPPPPAPEPMSPLPTPHFGRRDPKEKAQRLARVLVSDIILYNPDRHQRALEEESLKEEFEDEIQKSWNEYVEQVGEEIAYSTNFFNEALNEILAKGENIF